MFQRTVALAFPSSSRRIKVAILGSGLSGCSAANTLVEYSKRQQRLPSAGQSGLSNEHKDGVSSINEPIFDITICEAGRGIGGRMSTRKVMDDEGGTVKYQFDHGCQYIFPPKTNEFQQELARWRELGWIKQWNGKFGTVRGSGESVYSVVGENGVEDERYVGVPSMNSICENMLQTNIDQSSECESTITVLTQTHVSAEHISSNSNNNHVWQLQNIKNNELLDTFDWLVVTDRNSAAPHRKDLRSADLDEHFRKPINESIESLKSCTVMLAFEKRLPLPFDVMRFDNHDTNAMMKQNFGMLGWIARDSSKPGRQTDESEVDCWVLQSTADEATRLLNRIDLKGAPLDTIRDAIKDAMVQDFLKAIPTLMNTQHQHTKAVAIEIPNVVYAAGHRWGAAFPKHITHDCVFPTKEFHFDVRKHFIACGDYFTPYHGSVESAWLSGHAAAQELLRFTSKAK
eukprot:scaffold191_cov189-Alexandrium_tamarense.AAC.6